MSGSSTGIIDACTYKLPSCSVQQPHFLCCIIFVFWFLLAPEQKSVVFSYCECRKILLTSIFLNTLGLGRHAGMCRRCWSPEQLIDLPTDVRLVHPGPEWDGSLALWVMDHRPSPPTWNVVFCWISQENDQSNKLYTSIYVQVWAVLTPSLRRSSSCAEEWLDPWVAVEGILLVQHG